jgi:hypothetical protein
MATTSVTIAGGGWTDLGAGPLALIAGSGPVDLLIYSGGAAPGSDNLAARVQVLAGVPLNYQFTANLFAKLAAGGTASVACKVIA